MGSRSQTAQTLPAWALPYAGSLLPSTFNEAAPGSTLYDSRGNPFTPGVGTPGADALSLKPMDPALLQQVAGFNPTQLAGLGILGDTAGPSLGLAGQGAGEISNTLAGQYLSPNSNPFINATYDAASRGMVNQYRNATAPGAMVSAQQAGVAGGSADQQNQASSQFSLGQNLSDLAAQIYGGNYAAERQLQAQAPGQVGAAQASLAAPGQQLLGAGTLQQGQTQAEMDAATANAALKQSYPYTVLSALANMLGGATTGGGQITAGTSK